MISYLGSLVQFSPAAGRAGPCRRMSPCMGSTRRVPARQPAVLGASLRVLRAFSLRRERLGWPEAWRPLHGHAAPFPSTAPARAAGQVSGSLQTGTGLFAGWEGVASLGLSLPLSPPPASYLQQGWGGSSLEERVSQSLCFANRQRCVPAGQFFSRSPTVLKNLPPTALRAFWPVLTLRNAAGSSPFRPLLSVRPLLLVAGSGVWGYFSAGSCF